MAAIFPALYSIIWLYNRIFLNIAYTILQLICTPRVSRIPASTRAFPGLCWIWLVVSVPGSWCQCSRSQRLWTSLSLKYPDSSCNNCYWQYLVDIYLFIYIYGTIHLAMPPGFAWRYIQNTLGSSLFSLRSCHFGACPIVVNLLDTPKHHIILFGNLSICPMNMHWDWDPCIHNFFPLQGAKRTFCCLGSAQAWKGTGMANTTCRVIEANATLERQHASGCIKHGGIEPQLQNLIWYPKKRHE